MLLVTHAIKSPTPTPEKYFASTIINNRSASSYGFSPINVAVLTIFLFCRVLVAFLGLRLCDYNNQGFHNHVI